MADDDTDFNPFPTDHDTPECRSISYTDDALSQFKGSMQKEGLVYVLDRYLEPGVDGAAEISSDEEGHAGAQDSPLFLKFDFRRPKPLRYPESITPLIKRINESEGEPNIETVAGWASDLQQHLNLTNDARQSVCSTSKEQSSSDAWYKERVCRLTSSNFGLICKRRPAYKRSLVEQLLYK